MPCQLRRVRCQTYRLKSYLNRFMKHTVNSARRNLKQCRTVSYLGLKLVTACRQKLSPKRLYQS